MNRAVVRFRDALPASTDVVVVGGGVIGVFASLYLKRLGKHVVLCEKGRIAGEQSSRNWGWIRCMNRDPAELPLAMEAQRLWKEVDQELEGACGFTQHGIHYLCSTEQRLADWDFWLDIAKQHGLGSHMMTGSQVAAQFPGLSRSYAGALCTPTDGRAEPWAAVPAVARLAHGEGVVLREECAVRGIDVEGGRVAGVITESGRVRASQVVLAGGAWSSMLARRLGIDIPQLLVRGTVAATGPLPEYFAGQVKDEEVAIRRRQDGGYTLALPNVHHFIGPDSFRHALHYLPMLRSRPDVTLQLPAPWREPNSWQGSLSTWSEDDEQTPFEATRVLDPPPDPATVDRLCRLFAERFPGALRDTPPTPPTHTPPTHTPTIPPTHTPTTPGGPTHSPTTTAPPTTPTVPIATAWAGMIDVMPDAVPVVDRTPQLHGLIMATGMSAHGFGIGPAFGKAVARMVTGREVGHDMTRFRSTRFTDGSVIRPGPGL